MSGENNSGYDDYVPLGTPSTQSILDRLKQPQSTPPPTQVVPERRTPRPPSPPSTQIMPERIKQSIVKAEAEIQGLVFKRGMLVEERAELVERIEEDRKEIMRMNRELKQKEQRIKSDKAEIQELNKRVEKCQDLINSKQSWIDNCNALYP